MQNSESAEIAVVGNDGLVGVFLFMGGDFTSSRALVQSAGGAYRLTAQLMKEEFDRGGPVLHLGSWSADSTCLTSSVSRCIERDRSVRNAISRARWLARNAGSRAGRGVVILGFPLVGQAAPVRRGRTRRDSDR